MAFPWRWIVDLGGQVHLHQREELVDAEVLLLQLVFDEGAMLHGVLVHDPQVVHLPPELLDLTGNRRRAVVSGGSVRHIV